MKFKKIPIKKIGISKDIPDIMEYFSQIDVNQIIDIPINLPNIGDVISVFVSPRIISVDEVGTIEGVSLDGEKASGLKLVIEMEVNQKILYASSDPSRSIYSIENTFFERAYVSVPKHIEGTKTELLAKYKKIKLNLFLFDIIAKKINPRRILTTSFFFVEAKYKPTHEICFCGHNESESTVLSICYDDGNNFKRLIEEDLSKKKFPSWAPNGQEIAYLSDGEGNYMLYILNVNYGIPIRITNPNIFDCVTSYCWNDIGNKVYFSAVSRGKKDIYAIDVKKLNYERLTYGEVLVNNYKPKCCSNGEKISYIRSFENEKRLYVMDNDGLNVRQLTNQGCIRDYDWSFDNKHIVYISEEQDKKYRIYVVNADTGKNGLITAPNNLDNLRKVRYSPLGKFISYIGNGGIIENIYLYDTQKKTTMNLTKDIKYKTISDYVWKIDEEKMYIASNRLDGVTIYSLDIERDNIREIMNDDFSYVGLSYRPRVI